MIDNLPNGWKVKKLGDISKIKTGRKDANQSSENGEYLFFTCSKNPLKSDEYSFSGKAIILAGNGDLNNIFLYDGNFEAYQRTYVIQNINQDLRYEFLFYNLKYFWVKYNEQKQYGSIINYIKIDNLNSYPIPIPPLQQQEKIVKVLDLTSNLIEKQKELLEKYDLFLKSKFVEMFGDPISNPMGWEVVELENIIINIDSGWSPVCNDRSKTENENGILKLSALTNDTYNQIENKAMFEDIEPKYNTVVKKGDLLFSRKNTYELVGSSAYVFNTDENLFLPDLIFRINSNEKVNKIFLWKLFTNIKYKLKLKSIASGTSGSMPNISKTKLLKLDCYNPSIELQNKFALIVEKIEIIKEKENQKLKQLEDLHNSMMNKAFKGEIK